MRMRNDERGFGLILLIGITAALAILTAMLVVMLDNHMHTAEHERYTKTSLYYAEAALNSAMGDLENNTAWQTSSFSLTSATLTALNQNYSTLSGGPTVTYMVYDNLTPVNTAVNWDSNGDGKVWVQATVAYQGRTTMVRQLLSSSTTVSVLPLAAAWADTNMTLSGTSNIYAVNASGSNCTSGPPYETTVMVGGNFTGDGSANLADPRTDRAVARSAGKRLRLQRAVGRHAHDGRRRPAERLLQRSRADANRQSGAARQSPNNRPCLTHLVPA